MITAGHWSKSSQNRQMSNQNHQLPVKCKFFSKMSEQFSMVVISPDYNNCMYVTFDPCVVHVPQVYPEGIRHIRADKRVNEWRSPGKRTISRAAINDRQVVIALSGGELVYFEMDQVRACMQGSGAALLYI